MPKHVWTRPMEELLETYTNLNCPDYKIIQYLGNGFTENAIRSKRHAMGLKKTGYQPIRRESTLRPESRFGQLLRKILVVKHQSKTDLVERVGINASTLYKACTTQRPLTEFIVDCIADALTLSTYLRGQLQIARKEDKDVFDNRREPAKTSSREVQTTNH